MTHAPQATALYERHEGYIPRVAAIHDLCGYGKCSLGVAIPVLSAAGCDVCPVPTGLFSSHTAFPGWYMHDTTDILADYLAAWQGIGVELDAVYSGFLGAPEQVDIIKQVWDTYPDALRVVDPVMADHGKVYPTYTTELVAAMGTLADGADILTPNLTEAAIILGREWEGADVEEETVRSIMGALRERGAKNVVLKGIEHGDGLIHNYVWGDSVDFTETTNAKLPYMLHGTGDVFASTLLAAVMAGRDLACATAFAADFSRKNLPPCPAFPFGTDWMGRDMLARTAAGLSLSIRVGALTAAVSGALALVLGTASAVFGGWVDGVISWVIDLVMGIPHMLLIILISIACGRGFWGVTLGVALSHWPALARVLRGEALQLRQAPSLQMARRMGVPWGRVLTGHIVPHLLPQLLAGLILQFPHAILHEASISFLGYGLPPEQPAIGIILAESMKYLSAGMWWLAVCPGLLLVAVVLLIDRLGENLRRIVDPYSAQE